MSREEAESVAHPLECPCDGKEHGRAEVVETAVQEGLRKWERLGMFTSQ